MNRISRICFAVAMLVLAVAFPLSAQSVQPGSKITVGFPSMQGGSEADTWVPIYVQGQLTTDIQNYSGLVVIDRQAAKQLMEEQKIVEQNAYLTDSDNEIQYASLVEADYLVSVMLIKTGSSFSLQCSVQAVKSSTLIGKVYSAPNLSETNLSDGSAIHKASYELLKGIGVPEDSLAALRSNSREQQAAATANVYTAKGMAVEQEGGSVVQAMAYYQKAVGSSKSITEAAARLDGLTSQITGVNLGTAVINDMKLRNQWQKIWTDMIAYVQDNWCNAVYDPSLIDITNIDYNKNTTDLVLPVAVRLNPEVHDLWCRLRDAYKKTPKRGDWNLKESNWSYWCLPYTITMKVYNTDGDNIALAIGFFKVSNSGYISYSHSQSKYCDDFKKYSALQRGDGELITTEWETFMFTARNINPESITDNLTIKLEPNCEGGMVRAMQSKEMSYNAK